jgi:two-component system response regulator VicR
VNPVNCIHMSNKSHILYVEDDPSLAFITRYNLEARGYLVTHCTDGNTALSTFADNDIGLCLLDVMLPGLDGFSLASCIRDLNKDVPIIFLTVRSLLEDKITGLKLGADDFICKPFHLEELILKMEIFLKRPLVREFNEDQVCIGRYKFDFDNLKLGDDLVIHALTLKEGRLIRYLYERKNTIVRREDILKAVWGDDDYFLGRSLDVFISRLRKYFANEEDIKFENIHSVGFRMRIK